jgi:hypothetical protein
MYSEQATARRHSIDGQNPHGNWAIFEECRDGFVLAAEIKHSACQRVAN